MNRKNIIMAKDEVSVPSIKSKRKDGKEVSYRIKEISNGFVIDQSIEWKDKNGNFKHESKEFFVEDNPAEKESQNMFDIIKGAVNDTEF